MEINLPEGFKYYNAVFIIMSEYKPMLSNDEIEKRRLWQDEVYKELKKIKNKQMMKVLGKEIIVIPGLFAPIFVDSITLAETVRTETLDGDYVLDLGTGTGIQGLFAAEKAAKVIAVDINKNAIECAKLNVKHHNLEDKINVFESDLFSNVNDKFDMIIFNPPFRWFKPRDMLEKGEVDEDYKTLNKFFKEVLDYLKKEGRILFLFSTSGDLKYTEILIKNSKLKCKMVKQIKIPQNLRKVEIDEWIYRIYILSNQ